MKVLFNKILNKFYIVILFIKFSATPPTVIYPFPIVPLLGYSLSPKFKINTLIHALLFVTFYCSSANLWNHLNDAEVDVKFGRKEFEILINNKFKVLILVIILYIISFLFVIYYTYDKKAIYLFAIAVAMTWLYSDKIVITNITKFKFRRFKEHYLSEIMTYIIVLPTSTLTLWTFFSKIDLTGLAFALVVSIFYLAAVILKDLKDISADIEAGYETLGVVFSPEKILKLSIFLNVCYYIFIILFSLIRVFPLVSIISVLPSLALIYVINTLNKVSWTISIKILKTIKIYIYSYLLSLILFMCILLFLKFYIRYISS